jgi:hypothetical protein
MDPPSLKLRRDCAGAQKRRPWKRTPLKCAQRGLTALRAAVAAFAAGGIALAIVAALASATAATTATAVTAFALLAVLVVASFRLRLAVAESATVAFAPGLVALAIVALAATTAAMAAALMAMVAFATGLAGRRGGAVGGGGLAATEEAFQPAEKPAGFLRHNFRRWFLARLACFKREVVPRLERLFAARFA